MTKPLPYRWRLEYNADLEVDKGFVVKKNHMHKLENTFALSQSNEDGR